MKCVDWDLTKKISFESPPPDSETGNPRMVVWVTRKQKCSNWGDQLRIKEGEELEDEETEEVLLLGEDPEEEEEDITPEQIREHFQRFLKGVII